MERTFSAIHVNSAKIFRVIIDTGKTHADPPIRIRAAESAAVTPSGIELVIRSPGYRPQIASGRRRSVGLPIPGDALDNRAGRVGDRAGNGAHKHATDRQQGATIHTMQNQARLFRFQVSGGRFSELLCLSACAQVCAESSIAVPVRVRMRKPIG